MRRANFVPRSGFAGVLRPLILLCAAILPFRGVQYS